MPPSDSLPQLSEAYMENSRWMLEHFSDIAREHPDQWVAAANRQVVAADPDLGVVTAAAARFGPESDTVFVFVGDGIFAA